MVERRDELAEGVVALTLVSATGAELPAWSAGAHIDLVLDDGMVRQYSLCGDPDDRTRMRVAVLREAAGRGGSIQLHDHVREGSTLTVRGPRNHFELVEAERYVFVAGGIGVTPILPMIESAERRGRPWRLYYGGRSRASMAFVEELEARSGAVSVLPADETGLLPLADILVDAGTAAIYCCGPEALLTAIEAECGARGLTQLRTERFAPRMVEVDGPDGEFEVELAQTGLTLRIGADESILDVLEREGVPMDSSCRDGTCGSCETGVLEGEPDHRDSVLTPQEQEESATMLVCVSRCRGRRLLLDL
ncbi:MAG: ferredoxin [Pseudonocardia sp. SCN 72-86]|nr:MAG: ferredoxin [Pseudonocardia sp. SCN 72-86]